MLFIYIYVLFGSKKNTINYNYNFKNNAVYTWKVGLLNHDHLTGMQTHDF